MTTADLKALREVPGCGREEQYASRLHAWTEHHDRAADFTECDACLSLLAAAVIRQAVERLPPVEFGNPRLTAVVGAHLATVHGTTLAREALLDALLPTPPTPAEPTT